MKGINWTQFKKLHTEERRKIIIQHMPKRPDETTEAFESRVINFVFMFPLNTEEALERASEEDAYNFEMLKRVVPQMEGEDEAEYNSRLIVVFKNRTNHQTLAKFVPKLNSEEQTAYVLRLLQLQQIYIWDITKFI